jgi:hypothetical protein
VGGLSIGEFYNNWQENIIVILFFSDSSAVAVKNIAKLNILRNTYVCTGIELYDLLYGGHL